MKKRIVVLILICILLLSFCGCMTKKELSEYNTLSYNVIWDKAEPLQTTYLWWGTIKYYKIEGVSDNNFIAYRDYYQKGIGSWWYWPYVLVHGEEADLVLDASSARFTCRNYNYSDAGRDDEYWMNLGEKYRTQVLPNIEQEIAQGVIDQLATKQPQDINDHNNLKSLYYMDPESGEKNGYLTIEIYLEGYENLLWHAEIVQFHDDYLMVIKRHPSKKAQYIRCDDAISELIDQVVNEYGLKCAS